MMEIAIPGEYFFDVPANANVIGKIAAVPKPTKQNPNNADQKCGKTIATNTPDVITVELNTYVFFGPICSINLSEKNLDRAIHVIKER